MYLCDKDIKSRLTEIRFQSDEPNAPFDTGTQIQPSSIDLRLSNIFWEPTRGRSIDLRKRHLMELEPRRYWKKRMLRHNECITLKPGQLILGRTSEEFSIPKDCAGKIEGRSSFARMGIGVHCTGDYINPGYRGRMPLEIFNFGPNSIKVFPHIPICQLVLIRLSDVPERLYGVAELQSKYMNDDGGPSYWWRDKRIEKLQELFQSKDVTLMVQEDILKRLGIQEPEVIERFEKVVLKLKEPQKENADTLLDVFSHREDALRKLDKCIHGFALALFPLLASVAAGAFLVRPFTDTHFIIWTLTVLTVLPFFAALREPHKEYLGCKELEELKRRNP
jgi:deoxycytidine triphosphate deaminase